MFNEFIKNYNILRTILRECFLYGCYSREDLEKKMKISSRKISYEIRRIQQFIGQEYIKIDKYGRYNLLNLTYDFLRHRNNFLIKTYLTKSFTKNDIVLYFSVLMYLQSEVGEKDFNEIEAALIENGMISYEKLSRKTLERKLNEMSKDLYQISIRTERRKKFFAISKDILKNFCADEIKEIYLAVKLFKNIVFPTTFGYYLEDSLCDYLNYQRNVNVENLDCFTYKNLYYHPAIEEELLWTILNAIHNRNKISIKYRAKKTYENSKGIDEINPYKIRFDVEYGRLYLVSITDSKKCIITRIDRIEEVYVLKTKFIRCEFDSSYEKCMKNSWSSAKLYKDGNLKEVKFNIVIDEKKEKYILDKIICEAPMGKLKKIKDGFYEFNIMLNDNFEIIPWLRSYSEYIKIIGDENLKKRVYEDLKETLKNYGVI